MLNENHYAKLFNLEIMYFMPNIESTGKYAPSLPKTQLKSNKLYKKVRTNETFHIWGQINH